MVNVKALDNISANRRCEDGSFHNTSFPFFFFLLLLQDLEAKGICHFSVTLQHKARRKYPYMAV